ncbi:transcriptional repressor NrdR [Candidatus Micrarchaeota archaeon]|nr:transcriptional repressor NrdR [Candidatus Micrarchaeota archaeon]
MRCPFCLHEETRVLDKREAEDAESNRRRRECLNSNCAKRFTTYERVEAPELTVMKKDGRREMFEPAKVRSGILHACEKTRVTGERIDRIVSEIEAELRFGSPSEEVTSSEIGERIMEKLRALDKVAYIRFASVYREFADVAEFERMLKEMKKEDKAERVKEAAVA